ncbi:unnamed protein product, partial [Phaeothamnion confervicola]
DNVQEGIERASALVHHMLVPDAAYDEIVGTAYEALLRNALSLPCAPAVISLVAPLPHLGERAWSTQELDVPIVEAYGVPMVSSRDAVRLVFENKPA